MIGEYGSGPEWNWGGIYANGRLAATYSDSTTFFPLADQLGTPRVWMTSGGSISQDCSNLAFGDGATCAADGVQFTGQTHDSATGLDNFKARYYSPMLGRFMTPDPAGMAAASLADPQTFNRYAYVGNSPLGAIDPFGLSPIYCLLATARRGASGGGCGSGGRYGGGGHTIDGVDLGFSLGDELTGGGFSGGGSASTLPCPAGGCNQIVVVDGHPYTPEPTQNGWQYQNDWNGEFLSPGAGAEIGLPSLNGPTEPSSGATTRTAGGPPYLPSPDTAGLSALVGGMAAVTRPFEITAANSAILFTGGAEFYFGGAIAFGACADFPADLLTCIPGGTAGYLLAAQGGATVYGSYLFFRHITIPAWANWGQP